MTNNRSHEYSWRIVLYTYRSAIDDQILEGKDSSLDITSIVLFGFLENVDSRDFPPCSESMLTSKKEIKESADVTIKESGACSVLVFVYA